MNLKESQEGHVGEFGERKGKGREFCISKRILKLHVYCCFAFIYLFIPHASLVSAEGRRVMQIPKKQFRLP